MSLAIVHALGRRETTWNFLSEEKMLKYCHVGPSGFLNEVRRLKCFTTTPPFSERPNKSIDSFLLVGVVFETMAVAGKKHTSKHCCWWVDDIVSGVAYSPLSWRRSKLSLLNACKRSATPHDDRLLMCFASFSELQLLSAQQRYLVSGRYSNRTYCLTKMLDKSWKTS